MFMKTAMTAPPVATPVVREQQLDAREWDDSVLEHWLYLNDVIHERNMIHMESIVTANLDGCPDILIEGLKDAGNKFLLFLKELITRIKEVWQQIVLFFRARFASMDRLIRDHREMFSKDFAPFEAEGYEYTTSNFNMPDVTVGGLIGDFNALLAGVGEFDKELLEKTRQQWVSENELDKIRGRIVKTSDVSSEDFQDSLRRSLRNGVDDKQPIMVTSATVSNLITQYTKAKETYKKVEKENQKMIHGLERLQSFFKASAYTTYKGSEKMVRVRNVSDNDGQPAIQGATYYDMTHHEKINAIFNLCWTRTEKISGITNVTLTAVATAMRDEVKQTEALLRAVLKAKSKKKQEDIVQ